MQTLSIYKGGSMKKFKLGAIICGVIGVLSIAVGLLYPASKKTYLVYFDTDGGSIIESQSVKENETVSMPTNPTKENHTFVRWEKDNSAYDFSNKVKENITLKAVWSENQQSEKYKVTFVLNGVTKEMEVSSANEIDFNDLGFDEKDGYEIKWYVNGSEYNSSITITSGMKIEGKYVKIETENTTKTFTVKFDSKGGTSVKSQKVENGQTATEPDDIVYEGYIFEGWYLNNNKYDFETPVTKNITLVAKWKEDPEVKRYTVKFDSDGGSSVSSQRIIENKQATAPKNPTKKGYVFVEWDLDNVKYDFKTKVTKDITLKAKWEKEFKYTVVFDSNGGTSIANQTITVGNKVTKPTNPKKNGYTFEKWLYDNKEFDFTKPLTVETYGTETTITLVARYTVQTTYTVTFNSDGGTSVPSQTVVSGGTAKEPSKPTKSGATFKEWRLNGSAYNFNSPVTSNITLVAFYQQNPTVTYTVTFNSDGGTSVPSQTVASGGTAKEPSKPTKSGATFKEWQLNGSTYNFNSPVTSNITLKAIYISYTFRVSAVDEYSPDRTISVYQNGSQISFTSIKINGDTVCSGSNPTVNRYEIEGVNSITVVLTNGTSVTATRAS